MSFISGIKKVLDATNKYPVINIGIVGGFTLIGSMFYISKRHKLEVKEKEREWQLEDEKRYDLRLESKRKYESEENIKLHEFEKNMNAPYWEYKAKKAEADAIVEEARLKANADIRIAQAKESAEKYAADRHYRLESDKSFNEKTAKVAMYGSIGKTASDISKMYVDMKQSDKKEKNPDESKKNSGESNAKD